jgi:hypothetical protein
MSLRPPAEYASRRAAAASTSDDSNASATTASHEVSSPTASPRAGQRHVDRVCLARSPAPSGFRNLVAPSSAPRLPALFHAGSAHGVVPSRALLHSCSRAPSPAPLPSWRSSRLHALPKTAGESRGPRPCARPTTSMMEGPADASRLQGFAPHESPPLHTSCLGPRARVALLGFLPPGLSPSPERCRLVPAPPLMRLRVGATSRPFTPSPGYRFQRDRLVSLETAGPPGIVCLLTLRESSGWTRLGSHLLESRGALPSPADPL